MHTAAPSPGISRSRSCHHILRVSREEADKGLREDKVDTFTVLAASAAKERPVISQVNAACRGPSSSSIATLVSHS